MFVSCCSGLVLEVKVVFVGCGSWFVLEVKVVLLVVVGLF